MLLLQLWNKEVGAYQQCWQHELDNAEQRTGAKQRAGIQNMHQCKQALIILHPSIIGPSAVM